MSDYLLQDWLRKPPPWRHDIGSRTDWSWLVEPLPADRRGVTALCRDWVARRKDPESPICTRRDDVVDYCQAAGTLAQAVQRACGSFRPDGRLHNHQSRVPFAVRQRYAEGILWRLDEQRLYTAWEEGAATWGHLWRVCDSIGQDMPGVGPVFTYDVATRIGAWLGVAPAAVYLKAGTLEGTRAVARVAEWRPVYAVAFKTGTWIPAGWYVAWGMSPVHEYGGADALEDATCTLRAAFEALAKRNV